MSKRAALATQAEIDRAMSALRKLGYIPEVVINPGAGTVTVRARDGGKPRATNWRDEAPDRV